MIHYIIFDIHVKQIKSIILDLKLLFCRQAEILISAQSLDLI